MGRYYENEYLENTSGYALGYGPVSGLYKHYSVAVSNVIINRV